MTGGPEGGNGGDDPNTTDPQTTQDDQNTPQNPADRVTHEQIVAETAPEAERAAAEVSGMADGLDFMASTSQIAKELYDELPDKASNYQELVADIAYLEWLQKRIKARDGMWFESAEIDPKGTKRGLMHELLKVQQKINLPGRTSHDQPGDAYYWQNDKETLDAIQDLLAGKKRQLEKRQDEIINRMDRAMLDFSRKLASQDVPKNKKAAFKKMSEAAVESVKEMQQNDDGKTKEQQIHQRRETLKWIMSLEAEGTLLSELNKRQKEANVNDNNELEQRYSELKAKKDKAASDMKDAQNQINDIVSDIESRVKPRIEKIFAEDKDLGDLHTKAVDKALKTLKGWDESIDDALGRVFKKTGLGIESYIKEDGTLDEDKISEKPLSLADFMDIVKDPSVSEEVRQSAKVLAEDFMDEVDRVITDVPESLLKDVLPDYKKEVENYLQMVSQKPGESSGYEIYWLSIHDFKNMGEKLVEWAKRQYTRRSDKNLGNFGSSLLSDLPGPLKTAANEFDRLSEQSEVDNVGVYKQSYENKDAWQITEIMHKTRHPDELKACLILLSDMGRIRWDDPKLWAQLMYFSNGAVQFNVKNPEAEMAETGVIHEKLKTVIGLIWDFDTYQGWQTTNESNYKSKMDSHADFCDRNAEMPGGLDRILQKQLAEYKQAIREGRTPKIDPQQYEKMIHYNIEFGKGSPENKLYYMIQGVAWGLLPRDILSRFDSKHINAYPVIDIFGSETALGEKPTMADIRRWAKYDGDKNAAGKSFNRWFHSHIIHQERVYQRVDKALTQGVGQDHDDATCWFGVMGANTAKSILTRGTQGFTMPVTGFQNATVGMLQYLDTLIDTYDSLDGDLSNERSAISQVVRFANMFTTFDGITAKRMYANQTQYFKWNGEQHKEPRYAGAYGASYGRGKSKTQENIEVLRKYMAILDPELFGDVFSGQSRGAEDVKQICRNRAAAYGLAKKEGQSDQEYDRDIAQKMFGTPEIPANMDQLQENVGNFLRFTLTTEKGKANLAQMKAAIKADHATLYSAAKMTQTAAEKQAADSAEPDISTSYGGVDPAEQPGA